MAGKNHCWLFTTLAAFLCLSATVAHGQISQGGIPKSFSFSMLPDTMAMVIVDPPSSTMLSDGPEKQAAPYRFAINIPVDIGVENNGKWTLAPDGSRVWRVTLVSAGARALTLYFDHFNIPEGGRFFVYNPARTRLLGAFTSDNNDPSGSFATELLPGDRLTMEYDQLIGDPALPELHVSELSYAYRAVPDPAKMTDDFGQAGPCEVNVRCEEGNGWSNEKKGIARIAVKMGMASYWCSGSLVNNVRNDHSPYFLTAYHCGEGTTPADHNKWIFYFDYESAGCPNPAVEPFSKTTTGATLLSSSGAGTYLGSDFYLLRLNKTIPSSWDVWFNGWSRQESPPAPGVGIHHPEGDIKKISTYTAQLQPSTWGGGPSLGHWMVTWVATANGHGVTEGGSSGSPIFDNGRHIVGTLTGGDSSCDSLFSPDYYGRFSYHWDKNGTDATKTLKYWLDPDNTNTMVLSGTALSVEEVNKSLQVRVSPNPFTDVLNVELPGIRGTVIIRIFDLTGNRIMQQEFVADGSSVINLSTGDLVPGLYYLGLSGEGFSRGIKLIRQR